MTDERNDTKTWGTVETTAIETELESRGASATWHVLVVEDVPSQQKLLVKVLSKLGHTVATADSGRDAIDLVEREPFDIVLMDVQMPGMSGLEAIRAIRARELSTEFHLPIIAVTAHVLNGDAEQCYAAGADAFVPKPINLVDLIAVLRRTAEKFPRHDLESL
jgi:CheY-like chemotaxis protein